MVTSLANIIDIIATMYPRRYGWGVFNDFDSGKITHTALLL